MQLANEIRHRRGTRLAGLLTFHLSITAALWTCPQSVAEETPPSAAKSRLPTSRYAGSPESAAKLMSPEGWRNAPPGPVTPGEIDALLHKQEKQLKISPAPRTTDEQFLRRVTLDLTGQLPVPADVDEFVADKDPQKRAKLIDRLLDSEEYARHWARYWRDVIVSRATAQMVFLRLPRNLGLEAWFFEQLKANRSWAEITRDLITAEGAVSLEEPTKNGATGFLLCHFGPEADNERAAETARVFMGIQIQCAQCHDHPSDIWKRNQFHELAAFYGRTRERRMPGMAQRISIQISSAPNGEHQMPNLNNPKKSTTMQPHFLFGDAQPPSPDDKSRRKALADAVTSTDNYWFAAAYANRVWGELMGQAFYQPVDDMGPSKEAVLPHVLTRLAASFRAEKYDVKALFRDILNSETYQQQIRLGESTDQHLLFTAAYPTRLRADSLWESLVNVLGTIRGPQPQLNPRQAMFGGLFARLNNFEANFKREFDFDPSSKPDDVEGSIPQALLLMNNPLIDERIQAKGTNLLSRVLTAYPKDDDALRILYLRTLARKPTDNELEKCRSYIAKVDNRKEAYEDLLWALINSTEFQTKR
jgi:hypothetical protein